MAKIFTDEYLRSLIPKNLPDGRKVLQEGIDMGKTITAGESRYLKKRGFRTIEEYTETQKGKIRWTHNLGYPSVSETMEKALTIKEYMRSKGFSFETILIIPSMKVAVPDELKDQYPDNTGVNLLTQQDYDMMNTEEIFPSMANQITFVPDAVNTAVRTIKAGIQGVGTEGELMWDFPGCDEKEQYVIDALKAVGIIASKKDEGFYVSCYAEDGLAGFCADTISYVAYYMMGKYVYTDLCGVPLQASFGGLISNPLIKSALMLAFDRAAQPIGLGFVHASTTTQWEEDLECNYGASMQEILMTMLTVRHYGLGCLMNGVPITEHIAVPTLEEQEAIIGAAGRMEEFLDEWDKIIDYSVIDDMAEKIYSKGEEMFHYFLDDLDNAGIDIKDPLQMMMVFRNMDLARFEEAFHPSVRENGIFEAYYPNDMGEIAEKEVIKSLAAIEEEGIPSDALKGKKILIGAVDDHSYGRIYVKAVLERVGAQVIDAGIGCSVQKMFDIADEEGVKYIGFSTHCGQGVGFAEAIQKIVEDSDKDYFCFMGGILNVMLPGHSAPVDATEMIRKLGVFASNDIISLIEEIRMK